MENTLSDYIEDDDDIPMSKLKVEVVKKFIKQIKSGFVAYGIKPEDVSMIIDQRAGGNLI